jgi:hypothetical protein
MQARPGEQRARSHKGRKVDVEEQEAPGGLLLSPPHLAHTHIGIN